MPRERRTGEQQRSAGQTQPHVIHPTAIYLPEDAREALRLSKNCLAREVRLGRLRVSKRGGRYYFLGSWLLQWIEDGEIAPRSPSTEGQQAEPAATT
jgi:hypothetical protein